MFDEQDEMLARFRAATKSGRRILLTALALNVGCLVISVGGITLVVLGCLRLFGLI